LIVNAQCQAFQAFLPFLLTFSRFGRLVILPHKLSLIDCFSFRI